MSKNALVVKDNALINASYNLEVSEQRLMLMAIVNARETGQGITSDSALEISATDYADQFKVTKETAYITLKQAVENLFSRQFTFIERYKETKQFRKVKSRWVSRISYVEKFGILEITFAPDVVPLITRLEKHFTSYEIKQVSQLTSKYAIRLYEILIAWRTVKTTYLELAEFREKIGLGEKEYPTMDNLKRRVLEPAINQINKYTDLTVKYEQKKRGRTIVGFSFSFKEKPSLCVPKEKINVVSTEIYLTDKQIKYFANKLAHNADFSSKYAEVGEEYEDLEKRLTKKLTDKEFTKKIFKYLKLVGFE